MREKRCPLLRWICLIEPVRVVLGWIEQSVDQWPSELVDCGQPPMYRSDSTCPQSNPLVRTEVGVRYLQDDAEHILAGEEVIARELQVVLKAYQVGESSIQPSVNL